MWKKVFPLHFGDVPWCGCAWKTTWRECNKLFNDTWGILRNVGVSTSSFPPRYPPPSLLPPPQFAFHPSGGSRGTASSLTPAWRTGACFKVDSPSPWLTNGPSRDVSIWVGGVATKCIPTVVNVANGAATDSACVPFTKKKLKNK